MPSVTRFVLCVWHTFSCMHYTHTYFRYFHLYRARFHPSEQSEERKLFLVQEEQNFTKHAGVNVISRKVLVTHEPSFALGNVGIRLKINIYLHNCVDLH